MYLTTSSDSPIQKRIPRFFYFSICLVTRSGLIILWPITTFGGTQEIGKTKKTLHHCQWNPLCLLLDMASSELPKGQLVQLVSPRRFHIILGCKNTLFGIINHYFFLGG